MARAASVALAAAAGLATTSIYHRRRNHPGFAREMRLALETGYRRLEKVLLESYWAEAHADDAWRHNDPPPIPSMLAHSQLGDHRRGVAAPNEKSRRVAPPAPDHK